MDRGAWRATDPGVTKSQTRLSHPTRDSGCEGWLFFFISALLALRMEGLTAPLSDVTQGEGRLSLLPTQGSPAALCWGF